jgi:hypothetical protein
VSHHRCEPFRAACALQTLTALRVQKLAKGFDSKRRAGKAVLHSSGYGGSGFRFDHHEDDMHMAIKMRHAVDLKQVGEDDDDGGSAAARSALDSLRERTEEHGGVEAARIAAKYSLTAEQPPEALNVSEVRAHVPHACAARAARCAAAGRQNK